MQARARRGPLIYTGVRSSATGGLQDASADSNAVVVAFTVRPETRHGMGSLDGPVLTALGDWIDRTGSPANCHALAVRRIRRGRRDRGVWRADRGGVGGSVRSGRRLMIVLWGVNAAGTFGDGRVWVVGAMASSGFPSPC